MVVEHYSLMKVHHELDGKKYGSWVVVSDSGVRQNKKVLWKCRCACGAVRNITTGNLNNGGSLSCGCRITGISADDRAPSKPKERHGITRTPIYDVWSGMIRRCTNPNRAGFKNYGGRGIKVCLGLKSSPLELIRTIGKRPRFRRKRHYSVDRVDNDANYSCGKCNECRKNKWPMNLKWSTQRIQTRNTRNNRLITINGETKCMADWAESSGVVIQTISSRLRRGYSGTDLLAKSLLHKR